MPIEILNTWQSEFDALEKVNTPQWSLNKADWYSNMIANITPDPSVFSAVGFSFTFNSASFASLMSSAVPSSDPVSGISTIASAWESAILASIVICGPGSALVPPTPATTFSVVTSTIIDPSSILLGKTMILGLSSAPKTNKGKDSEFPKKFREATLQLKIIVSGMNSLAPTPSPLVTPPIPLI